MHVYLVLSLREPILKQTQSLYPTILFLVISDYNKYKIITKNLMLQEYSLDGLSFLQAFITAMYVCCGGTLQLRNVLYIPTEVVVYYGNITQLRLHKVVYLYITESRTKFSCTVVSNEIFPLNGIMPAAAKLPLCAEIMSVML